ncbi:PIG-L deacetylase family protein [Flavobacterium paronense]|uniref:PIG-L deacetylase family protein n=1 Tax=Flavobacterium paronense TaxID=1392775 RepID=A0ABV5GBY8_9FLAO|nr:PIG-L deacetylase family protein [Flavobacterium paronense]MDN3676685.1 PIG-L deacetylase family protein [Flavobacterium paronense]
MKKILVIAPHPDDEVLGCGGIIKKYAAAGNSVYVLIVTRGTPKLYSDEKIKNVRNEAKRAHEILEVKETLFFDFIAPDLDITSRAEISRAIAKVIQELQIEELYLPHRGDIHHDHGIVFHAGLVAARPVNNSTVKRIFTYETLSETEWAAPFSDDAFIPNHFVNIEAQMKSKLDAMICFGTQVKSFPSTRSLETIEALAKYRGATVGFARAEAFMVIRTIE